MLASELIVLLARAVANEGDLDVQVGLRTLDDASTDGKFYVGATYDPATGGKYLAFMPDLD
ncbi:hypothetical protein [Cryobacterium sp. PH31-O1]|uniref:hypothetical protein n=1 Tax=Cryobacterium sp. PH31-O1 TaxID=3046306 RepID=UPI0024BB3F7D|nr:hypothetical protein [Cryobacterium sp. PH31-O1]MDJ0338254.1 hypothetical protein [Cryobacterium sp. PH31-O1]